MRSRSGIWRWWCCRYDVDTIPSYHPVVFNVYERDGSSHVVLWSYCSVVIRFACAAFML